MSATKAPNPRDPYGRPALTSGIRFESVDGRVITASPMWACVWSRRALVGRDRGLVAGPFRIDPPPRDVDDLIGWYVGWLNTGEPS